jgi:hypothetical protein
MTADNSVDVKRLRCSVGEFKRHRRTWASNGRRVSFLSTEEKPAFLVLRK